jgi:PEP-CTERM motif
LSIFGNTAYASDVLPNLDTHLPLQTAISGGGYFYFDDEDDGDITQITEGDFSAGTVRITQAGVPEPATWALMLAGLGSLGAALRSRRGQPAEPDGPDDKWRCCQTNGNLSPLGRSWP